MGSAVPGRGTAAQIDKPNGAPWGPKDPTPKPADPAVPVGDLKGASPVWGPNGPQGPQPNPSDPPQTRPVNDLKGALACLFKAWPVPAQASVLGPEASQTGSTRGLAH